ncbi:MAG: hypothetical protein IRZ16_17280, partial [Myxococcaceae bacterium]|nr:hypothetical protein [Myxococcaceae bacterium]
MDRREPFLVGSLIGGSLLSRPFRNEALLLRARLRDLLVPDRLRTRPLLSRCWEPFQFCPLGGRMILVALRAWLGDALSSRAFRDKPLLSRERLLRSFCGETILLGTLRSATLGLRSLRREALLFRPFRGDALSLGSLCREALGL